MEKLIKLVAGYVLIPLSVFARILQSRCLCANVCTQVGCFDVCE
jgi:hypothetical protein